MIVNGLNLIFKPIWKSDVIMILKIDILEFKEKIGIEIKIKKMIFLYFSCTTTSTISISLIP